jgi:prefoldin alpha subunit
MEQDKLSQQDQEALFQASMLENQSQEMEQRLNLVAQQIMELQEAKSNLIFLRDSKEKETLSSLGKGIHLSTEIKDKKLFIEVGSGILVRKTPDQIIEVIDSQVKRLSEVRAQIETQLSIYHQALSKIIEQVRARR